MNSSFSSSVNFRCNGYLRKTMAACMLLCLPIAARAQAGIELGLSFCRTLLTDSAYTIRMNKDGVFVKTIRLAADNNFDVMIPNLDNALYTFSYTNLFGEKLTDTVIISKPTAYRQTICIDEFRNRNGSSRGFTDYLKNNEYFTIHTASKKNSQSSIIKLLRKGNDYYFSRADSAALKPFKLTPAQLTEFIHFQLAVFSNAAGNTGNPEFTMYIFRYKKKELKFIFDGESREWLTKLFDDFYGKKKQ